MTDLTPDECPTCGCPRECAEGALAAARASSDEWQALYEEARAEVERLAGEVGQAGLPCDGGCSWGDGPMEDCSRHGRPVAEVWAALATVQAERDAARAEVERLTLSSRAGWDTARAAATATDAARAREAALRERLYSLGHQWLRDQAAYPGSVEGRAAAAAVRLCKDEMTAVLAAPTGTEACEACRLERAGEPTRFVKHACPTVTDVIATDPKENDR